MPRPWLPLPLAAALLLLACSAPPEGKIAIPGAVPEALKAHSEQLRREVIPVTDGVWVAVGFGIANSILIDAPEGRIVVDTLETVEQAREVRAEFDRLSAKPIRAIVYTHNHPDHVYGAAAFDPEGTTPVYAHARTAALMDELVSIIRPAMNRRAAHMYGTTLTGDALVNVGIGPYVGMFEPTSTQEARRPTVTFEERLDVTVAGEALTLLHAPGETEDQLYVWLPGRKVLLSGDNYYRAFPNLYTLRGTSPRDPVRWYQSLDLIRDLEPEHLVPSHTRPLAGKEHIRAVITAYRDAIQYVHDQTVRGMNDGKSPDELAAEIHLPPHLAAEPSLQEFYGSVPWCVRAIYDGYLGWFDGRSTHLRPLPPRARAERMVALAGGEQALEKRIDEAAQGKDWPWVLELTDALLAVEPGHSAATQRRVEALKALGEGEANPNARHWFYTEALELERGQRVSLPNNPTPALVHALPMKIFFDALAVNLRAEGTLELERTAHFVFPDSAEVFSVLLRRGVAEIRPSRVGEADLTVTVDSRVWKEMLAGLRDPVAVMASGEIDAEPGVLEYSSFMRHFRPD